jgi:large subunit ribosomal protein L23
LKLQKLLKSFSALRSQKSTQLIALASFASQGTAQGYTASWKKAIVTLTEDSKTIEFFDGMM